MISRLDLDLDQLEHRNWPFHHIYDKSGISYGIRPTLKDEATFWAYK